MGTISHLKTGSTITEFSYDAWGRRRNALNWSYDLTGQPALFADRGFTGHEFLANFNLYNMNGRLYDPVVGRFLSPDPYIADPSFSQSYNRYAYALNNPLKYIDPTGEKLKWPKFEGFHWFPILGQFDYFMQFINDNTTKTRQKMVNAKIPNFGVNYNTTFGTGFSVGNNPAYYPFYENKIADGQRNISNQLAGFSGMGANIGSPLFGNGDVINQQFVGDILDWTKEHFYAGAEGEITYGVQLAATLKNGLGFNINPYSIVKVEGILSNKGKSLSIGGNEKLKILDFGLAYYVGANYNQTIDYSKNYSGIKTHTISVGAFGVFGVTLNYNDNWRFLNGYGGIDISGKVAAIYGASGTIKLGFEF